MMPAALPMATVRQIVVEALEQFVSDVATALPNLIAGVVFLALALVLVRAVMAVVRFSLARALPDASPVYRQFVATVVLVFLWFGVVLSFLSVVGLDDIAASIGTATGFVALGVAYALSNVIADAVAGVYLLRDRDFSPGDRVDVGGTVGTVERIDLRKTRLRVDGNTVVKANADIEQGWTRLGEGTPPPTDGPPADPGGSTQSATTDPDDAPPADS